MRTKALILTAAALAAGVASSMAQSNVYSLNVVGYVNLNLQPGLNLVANQLDLDGTGTNNTIVGVFSTNLPNNSAVYKLNPADGAYDTVLSFARGAWKGNNLNASLNPGEGAFVSVPSAVTITLVGQVLQGTNMANPYLAPAGGLSMVSSIAPISGLIDSTGNGGLGYVPNANDSVYQWDPVGQAYIASSYSRGAWKGAGGDPNIAVGAAFFLSTSGPVSWSQTFSVQ